jgi:hypothetical protein
MPYVTKAFKVVYSAVTAVFQSIGKLGSSIVKLFKGDFKGAWEDAKSSVTGFSDNYDTAVQRFEVGQKKMTKTQKENLKEQKKDLKEHTDETKKIREEELKELMDGQKEAMLELLSEREAEEFKVNEHYSRLLFLATKYGEDTTQLKAAQADALKEIDDKYLAKQAELDEKEKEKRLKDAEEFAKFSMEQYERIKELDEQRKDSAFKTNQAVSQSWVDLGNNISGIFGSLINVFAQGSAMAKAFGVAQVAINAASSIGQILVNARSAQFEYDKAIATGNAAILMSIPKLVNPITAPLGIAEAAAGKAAVAGGIAGKAALKVNTNLQIAAVGVSSAAQIAAILSSGKSKSSGAGGGGGSVASAGSGAIPNAPTIAGTAAPQITTTGGMNPTQQIGETISASQRPIRAYVISGDVTSQQALDRRTSRAATFSAG